MALESKFQKEFKERIAEEFPDCMILKGNSATRQGIPDLLILNEDKWVAIEIKRDGKAATQPNQSWYVDKLNSMSYSAIVEPNNADEVFRGIQETFRA